MDDLLLETGDLLLLETGGTDNLLLEGSTALSGVQASGTVGTLSISNQVALTGVQATGGIGTLEVLPIGHGEIPPGSAPPGAYIPIRPKLFIRLVTPNAETFYFAFTQMNDNPEWPVGGYKPAKLLYVSSFSTKLSNYPQPVTWNFTIADVEDGGNNLRQWRDIADTETIEGSEVTLFAIDDDIRLAGGEPYHLMAGEVVGHTTADGIKYEFEVQDVLTRRLASKANEANLPGYAYSTAFDKSVVGQHPQIAVGKFISGRGLLPGKFVATVNPQTLWGGTATNAEFDVYVHSMFAVAQVEALYHTMATWGPEQAITQDWYNRPTPTNATGFFYKATTPGTTGTSEPTWPTSIGATIGDGSVTWTCAGIDDPTIRFQVPSTAFSPTSLVTSGQPSFLTVTGGTTPYIDFEGQRFGIVTLVRRDFIYAKPLREGLIQIGVDAYGVTEFPDGTGRYFDTPEQALVFLYTQQIFARSTGITFAAMPTLNGYGAIDMDSVAESEAVHAARLGGDPYIVSMLIGRGGQQQSGFSLHQEICEGGDVQTGIDRFGRVRFSSEDTEAVAAITFDDLHDIKFCLVKTDTENNKNRMLFFGGPRYMPDEGLIATPSPGQPLPSSTIGPTSKWSFAGEANESTAQGKVRSIKEIKFENYATHDKATFDNVASSRFSRFMGPLSASLEQMNDGRKLFKCAGRWGMLGRDGVEVKLGTVIGITSVQGLSSQGYVGKRGRVEEITIDPMTGEITYVGAILHTYAYTLVSDVLASVS